MTDFGEEKVLRPQGAVLGLCLDGGVRAEARRDTEDGPRLGRIRG